MSGRALPEVELDGEVRTLNPRDVRADGSVLLQCIGGPHDRMVMRVYPSVTDPIPVPGGYYLLAGPHRKRGKDTLVFHQE